MSEKTLTLKNTIIVETKPKNKSIIWDICDTFPARLLFEYDVLFSYGTVADVNVTNLDNGKRLVNCKPSNISKVLSHVDWMEVK